MEAHDIKLAIGCHPVKREASMVPDFFINTKLDVMLKGIILNAKNMGKEFGKNPLAQSQQMREEKLLS